MNLSWIRDLARPTSSAAAVLAALVAPLGTAAAQTVGPTPQGLLVPTGQMVRPEGEVLDLGSRPVDLVLAPDGSRLYVKDNHGLVSVDALTMREISRLGFPRGGGSMTGLAITRDGRRLYATDSGSGLHEAIVADDGTLSWARQIDLPQPAVGGAAFGCGVALSPDERTALVCLSRGNALAVIDLAGDAPARTIDVGVAPYGVAVSPDGARAFVTNWGGRRAREGDLTAPSAGTAAVVDERGIAASGTVSVIDLDAGKVVAELPVGLSPSALALDSRGSTLYVAAANDDSITVIDVSPTLATPAPIARFCVRPDPVLPFGSMPSAMTLTSDGSRLLVANGGNNAVAVVDVADPANPRVAGFIPTGWFPGAVREHDGTIAIANIRGTGSRRARGDGAFNSHRHSGGVQRLTMPDDASLAAMTTRCLADARVPQALRALERARPGVAPVPVPENPGEPSVFEHVVYIIKENRTYDQVFGDFASEAEGQRGNGMPELCIYGRDITPNQHALAEQFVLLDNYYCNGVLSADGHSWATEGNVTPYLERSFGGFSRSYTFGDDPLTYSSSGFIWDHVLAAGLSFRNYGEFNYTHEKPDSSFPEIWGDWQAHRGGPGAAIRFEHNIGVETVRRYSCPDAPGWNMDIPDQVRADVFLREFAEFERSGDLPNLVIIYLPNDHTLGTGVGNPTPRALVADNDLALGRIVDAISHSRFWPRTAIFVNEDDPQDGWDHVDGHRSTCLVISPYTRRGEVVSDFFNQASVVHTIERILGVPGANQRYAMTPVMAPCFTDEFDPAPFAHLPSNIDIGEMNPDPAKLDEKARHWARASASLDFDRVDACPEDLLNRILWHAAKGVDTPYPAEWAGAHGRGLGEFRLLLDPEGEEHEEEAWEGLWGHSHDRGDRE